MPPLPVYDVEFIPLERRLNDRRVTARWSALPPGSDRRRPPGRRLEDCKAWIRARF